MQLFANATAKLSNDLLEIVHSKYSEIENFCIENDVLIRRRIEQVNSEFEVTGNFKNLITVYNRLAEYLESNFKIAVNQYEVRQKQYVHEIDESRHIDKPSSSHDSEKKDNDTEELFVKACVPAPIVFEFPSAPTIEVQDLKSEDKDETLSSCDKIKHEHAKEEQIETELSISNRKLRQKRTKAPNEKRQNLKRAKSIKHLTLNRSSIKNCSYRKRVQINLVSSGSRKLKNIAKVTERSNDDEENKLQSKGFKSNKKGKLERVKSTAKLKVKKIYRKGKGAAKENKVLKISKESYQQKDTEGLGKNNVGQITEKEVETNNKVQSLEIGIQQPENDKEKSLQCTQCEKHFKCRKQLSRHEKQHCNPTYCCKKCGKLYKSLKSYQDHEKSHEEGYVKPEFVCRDCGKAFSTKYVLQNHVKSEHLGMKKSYLCPTCGKSFTQKNSYLLHANVHLGIRPFICEICGDSFPYEKSLKEHKYMHDDIRRFKCKECGKCFRQPSALHTHMKVHKESREHLCGTCGKGFTQKQALSRHERIHSGDKPFSCNLCSRTFSDSSVIRRHMIMVHKMSQSEWRTEVTSNTTPHKGFFVEMPEGHVQPQLKRRGRPPAKEKESQEEPIRAEVVESILQSDTDKTELVSDQRANAALTLSSLAAGNLDSLQISKSTEQTSVEASNFMQKPADNMHCEISQSLPISNAFMGIANYTVVQSTPIQPTVPRVLENQQLLFSNLSTPNIGHLQTMDKESLLPQPAETFHEVEDSSAVRNDQWSGGPYQYMYLTNYSQFHQMQ